MEDGLIVVSDSVIINSGAYHRGCIDFYSFKPPESIIVYDLPDYLYQIMKGFGTVEKYEYGKHEQHLSLTFPYIPSEEL